MEEHKKPDEFIVEKILDRRHTSDNKLEYYIKWQGLELFKSSWEPLENLANVAVLVKQFDALKSEEDRKNSKQTKYKYRLIMPYDASPDKVKTVKMIDGKLCCLISWKEDSFGMQLEDCFIPTDIVKEEHSLLLIDFYETKIKFNK